MGTVVRTLRGYKMDFALRTAGLPVQFSCDVYRNY